MINLSFFISWPWFKYNSGICKDYFYKSWRVSKYKTLELQFSYGTATLIGASFSYNLNCNHAGLQADVHIFRRFVHVSFVDNRHWDYENNRYEEYE